MHALDWTRWILRALESSRMRSLLTATGIAIGICAVTLLTSIAPPWLSTMALQM